MATKQPNILSLWGDDIGMRNISRFSCQGSSSKIGG